MNNSKIKKQDEKLRRALEAGARMAERTISKIAWDVGHDKIKVVSGKLDYQAYWVLDCAADKIAQGHWFGQVLGLRDSENTQEPDRFLIVIESHEFKRFTERWSLSNKKILEIFDRIPDITLKGKTKIPLVISPTGWIEMESYKDNICGVGVATETYFNEYRSDRKLRGKGSKNEEHVFILLFSSPYGKSFFRNAMSRAGTQIQDPDLYRLPPEAQELFQAVRWNDGLIIINTERISKMLNWKWPPKNFYDRVYRIRKHLRILHENNFINKPIERGKTIEKKDWVFYVRKRKLIRNRQNIN